MRLYQFEPEQIAKNLAEQAKGFSPENFKIFKDIIIKELELIEVERQSGGTGRHARLRI